MHAQEVLLLFVVHTKITRSHDLGSGQYSGQLNWEHNRLGDTWRKDGEVINIISK